MNSDDTISFTLGTGPRAGTVFKFKRCSSTALGRIRTTAFGDAGVAAMGYREPRNEAFVVPLETTADLLRAIGDARACIAGRGATPSGPESTEAPRVDLIPLRE